MPTVGMYTKHTLSLVHRFSMTKATPEPPLVAHILSVLVRFGMTVSGTAKFAGVVEPNVPWTRRLYHPIGVLEPTSAILFVVLRTSSLGSFLDGLFRRRHRSSLPPGTW